LLILDRCSTDITVGHAKQVYYSNIITISNSHDHNSLWSFTVICNDGTIPHADSEMIMFTVHIRLHSSPPEV